MCLRGNCIWQWFYSLHCFSYLIEILFGWAVVKVPKRFGLLLRNLGILSWLLLKLFFLLSDWSLCVIESLLNQMSSFPLKTNSISGQHMKSIVLFFFVCYYFAFLAVWFKVRSYSKCPWVREKTAFTKNRWFITVYRTFEMPDTFQKSMQVHKKRSGRFILGRRKQCMHSHTVSERQLPEDPTDSGLNLFLLDVAFFVLLL